MIEPTAESVDVPAAGLHVLSAAATSLVVDTRGGVPRVLHWGARLDHPDPGLAFLATLHESQYGADGLDRHRRLPAVIPEQSAGWMGTPGLEGHRDGRVFSTSFVKNRTSFAGTWDAEQSVICDALDRLAELTVRVVIRLSPAGVAQMRATVTNIATDTRYTLNSIRLVLPVPVEAQELLDFGGRHLRERSPQRQRFPVGTHLREGRRGRTGSDATLLLCAGTEGFGFQRGEVWAIHTAWSGNHATFAEQGLTGVRILGGGEVLLPGEVVLAPGDSYTTPWLYGVHGQGLDAVAASLHQELRRRPTHPSSPRPVVLNTWEAVYFDQDLDSLVDLAARGAAVGVERFVLDDGWFQGRRDDSAGLGDWFVDRNVWPQGLGPLVDKIRGLGMQFGLWFEPEMVNEDSDLARAHPDWIMAPGPRLPLTGRNQHVLNLTISDAYSCILEAISALVAEHDIDYVKWDHNRDLVEAGDRSIGGARVHAQTAAVYALMDELRRRHPRLEIESCSSGGGRVDLEVLQRTDRVWASDCIDALERQRIQRWTGLLLPPELIGSHVGASRAHTTHRTHSLAFRAATALFGHFGIEWDLRDATSDELDELAAWVRLYKQERGLLHSGNVVHCDYPDDTYWAHGVVSADQRSALFTIVALDTSSAAQPGRLRLPGLDPATTYRVEPVELSAGALVRTRSGQVSWWQDRPLVNGQVLQAVGLQGPMLYPEQALLFRLSADDGGEDR
jgi:alpha-galactosidase